MGAYVGLYGNVAIEKEKCTACGWMSFVLDGVTVCCEQPQTVKPTCYKRETQPENRRKVPPRADQRAILTAQEDSCFYCFRRFGSFVAYKGKLRRLRIHWDHKVPYSFAWNNETPNFVAACNICNSLKGSRLFGNVDEARSYLHEAWQRKAAASVSDLPDDVPA